MFLRPPKVVFGGNGRAGRKGRELKESLVSPSVCGRWNIWSRGFPKMTRDRKYNSPPSPLPPSQAGLPPNEDISSGWRLFLLPQGMSRGHLEQSLNI